MGSDHLLRALFGHLELQTLWATMELGVFEALADAPEGLPLDALASRVDVTPRNLELLISVACAMRLVRSSEDGALTLTELARRHVLHDSPASIRDVVAWQAQLVYPSLVHTTEAFRTGTNAGLAFLPGEGTTLYERLAEHPSLQTVFQRAMAGMPSNQLLADAVSLDDRIHLCDCGGGTGRNAMALARRFEHLRCTIFDHPSVCDEGTAAVRAAGLDDRVAFHPGNFLEDAFPPGIDCVLYSHIGSIWSFERNTEVFRRAHQALPEGGRLMIFNMVPNDDATGPLSVVLGSIYFHVLATGEGRMHTRPAYEAMLRQAGFEHVERVDLPIDHALITGIK